MKILHTSDWHIGQVFKSFSRQVEHEMFFVWLKDTIVKEEIEVLLVAGDIFDVNNPSSAALKTYYNFLTSLQNTTCRKIIITGGNHDGIATLDAPKELLEVLNIDVVSGNKNSMEDKNNLIIPVYDKQEKLATVVCAVPYLRDQVVRKSLSNQSSADIETQLKEGIRNYYRETLEVAQKISSSVPIIAMGHLTVMGTSSSSSEQELYIGKLQSLNSSVFDGYDYVALGHLHRAQRVASSDTIRYSGSPIPLSFSEVNSEKKVLMIDASKKEVQVDEIPIPAFRKLFHIKGKLVNILEQLTSLSKEAFALTPLVEVSIEDEFTTTDIVSSIYKTIEEMNLEVLQINSQNREKEIRNEVEVLNLDDITPLKAFDIKLDENTQLLDDETRAMVIDCFKEIEEEVRHENS